MLSEHRSYFCLACVLVLAALPAHRQMNTGEIAGSVRDPTGAVVLNATVTAVEDGTQLKFTARQTPPGEFLLAQLPVGQYSLTVNAEGFKQIVQSNLDLHAGDHLRQPFTLELGEQSET